MLCSFGLRGGSLGIPAGAGGRSGFAFAGFGSSLESLGPGLGARSVAPPFRPRAPSLLLPPLPSSTKVCQGNLRFSLRSHYNPHRTFVCHPEAGAFVRFLIRCADTYPKPPEVGFAGFSNVSSWLCPRALPHRTRMKLHWETWRAVFARNRLRRKLSSITTICRR